MTDPNDSTEPIRIPAVVWNGIEAVRLSGRTNMLDRVTVALIACELGYVDAAFWIEEYPRLYARGIFHGFVTRDLTEVTDPSESDGPDAD